MMYVYALKEVSLIVGGIPLEEQIGAITITPTTKRITAKSGTDGAVTISVNNDRSATVKIQCMQSSQVNAILSGILKLAENSPAGTLGIVPIMIRDRQGTTTFAALNAVIMGWPELKFEAESGDREWEIFAADPETFVGGN